MRRPLVPVLAAAALATSTPAFAWEWEDEPQFRQWRTATLNWAQDIAFKHLGESYSHQDLIDLYEPPPREMWCVESPAPTQDDCQEKTFRVRLWVRDFLELAPNEPLPSGIPGMPPECQSICSS